MFEYTELIYRKKTAGGRETVFCSNSSVWVEVQDLLDGVEEENATSADEFADVNRGAFNVYGPVAYLAASSESSTSAVGRVQQTISANTGAKSNKSEQDDRRWNHLALLAGVAASGSAALLIFVPSNWWRAALAAILGAGLIAGYLVLGLHPKRFYRRLLAGWIPVGPIANLIGFVVDGAVERGALQLQFSFAADVGWWWWSIWGAVAVTFVLADLVTQRHPSGGVT